MTANRQKPLRIKLDEKLILTSVTHTGCEQKVIQHMDYSISSGLITLKGFFQVRNHKEYQNVVIISFVHLEKINIFLFYAQERGAKIEPAMPS